MYNLIALNFRNKLKLINIEMMKLEEAEEKFIEIWGSLGSQWGISRTMAQIHAFLMVKNCPKTTEEIMSDLQISRGNANMNTRALIDWGLVHKVIKSGERKEFFIAESDIWEAAKKISSQRRKRELHPLITKLDQLRDTLDDSEETSNDHIHELLSEISELTHLTDQILGRVEKVEKSWLTKKLMKLLNK